MRLRLLPFFTLLFVQLNAQVTLFQENFNGCALPTGWQVNTVGNPSPTWSVGISQNNDAPGQSIDGSCFLFIDDESEGNNTLAYTLTFTSPPFDASQHTTVELSMDVHYRDWDGANDNLEIFVKDDTGEKLISRFDKYRANSPNIADHFKLKADLSLLTQSPTARLIIRYKDGGEWVWWAGVDNIKITGSGTGTNVVREAFAGCAKPAGWTTEIVKGLDDWQFGLIQPGSNALQGGNSMDGTCFAYFDDDDIGGGTNHSTIRLATPWFDGTAFSKFILNYDVILRFYKEKIRVIVEHSTGEEFLVKESNGDVGGPYFPDYVHETLDISTHRSSQMRVVFEYWDGDDWGWWVGLDNVKITGSGVAQDLCANAVQLLTGAACKPSDNLSATFEGPVATCVGKSIAGIWYRWQADFSGTAKLTTEANFNDVVSIFTGSCAAPQAVFCDNRDEHGFTGETTYFPAQSGTEYLIRVSGQDGAFGVPRGELCIKIEQQNAPAPPANDDCAGAIALTANGNCTIGSNTNATTSPILPSLNLLARADVWYTFTAENLAAGEKLEIQSNASFSDIITLYAGGCANLQEVAGNHQGGILELPSLNEGQNYWVQIAGNFATIEGSLCPQLLKKQTNAPPNDDCVAAIPISLGSQCTAGANLFASPSVYVPTCIQSVERDVWFTFTAPSSGSVHLNTGADFEHTLAIWKGNCSALTQVFCAENPLRCDGFATATGLETGQTYYVQIASRNNAAGDICLKITDGANPPAFQPLFISAIENCVGQDTAELEVTVTGGVQPYVFSGNSDGELLLSGASYLVVVTDANGCEHSASGTIDACDIETCTMTIAVESVSPKCAGEATGSITAIPSGGTTPYTYQWSNGANTASITNIAAGIYSLTLTDAEGCSTTLSQNLTAPSAIAISLAVEQITCFGEANGAINTTVTGGAQPYQYKWSNNAETPSISNLAAGNYTLTVTDFNGCTSTVSQTLSTPVALYATPTLQHPKCHGDANGSISVTPSGGTSPYQFLWSSGATSTSIGNLPGGTYLLTLTDAKGCSISTSFVLTDPAAIQIAQENVIHPNQGQNNGAINVAVTGGTGTFNFAWFRNNVIYATGTQDLVNIPAGDYRLEVTDGNGCTAIFTYNLTPIVGTQNPNEAFYAEIFPNPARGEATLAVALPQPRTLRFSLTDVSGKILQEWSLHNVTEQHISLNLKDLPDGAYLLRILAGDDWVGRKVVVTR
jgi:hypothetical protein